MTVVEMLFRYPVGRPAGRCVRPVRPEPQQPGGDLQDPGGLAQGDGAQRPRRGARCPGRGGRAVRGGARLSACAAEVPSRVSGPPGSRPPGGAPWAEAERPGRAPNRARLPSGCGEHGRSDWSVCVLVKQQKLEPSPFLLQKVVCFFFFWSLFETEWHFVMKLI